MRLMGYFVSGALLEFSIELTLAILVNFSKYMYIQKDLHISLIVYECMYMCTYDLYLRHTTMELL